MTSQPSYVIIIVDKSTICAEERILEENIMSLIKLNSKIFRNNQIYLEKVLKKYDLGSGAYPYLLILDKTEGISQSKISCELNHDKAMSARTITKLIDLNYIYRLADKSDCRAYKLYLTEKAKGIIPEIKKEISKLINLITEGLNEEEKKITVSSLDKIFINIKNLNERGEI